MLSEIPRCGIAGLILGAACAGPVLGGAAAGSRPPAVAGSFYPGDEDQLRAAVQAFLADAVPPEPERPVALIVPHAGYVFSGQIAADAFRQVAGHDYDVVVILGPNHKAAGFRGIAVYDGPGYRTPLGVAPCDQEVSAALRRADPRFAANAAADAREHSVEVQVPFVQTVLPTAKIVAAVVGSDDPDLWESFGRALATALAGRRGLIVASSDLSHYPDHEDACASDRAVLAAAATMEPGQVIAAIAREMRRGRPQLATCACGEGPMVAAMTAARLLGATRATVLSYANSGDTPLGDRDRCVGYGAVVMTAGDRPSDTTCLAPAPPADPDNPDRPDRPDTPLGPADRALLLEFARRTIGQYLASGTAPLARGMSPALMRARGAFVTLKISGRLRGCIGHMAQDTPLGQVVGAMALQAAFDDPRFSPLQAEELPEIHIEISVLTPFRPVSGPEAVVVGRDGVLLHKDGRSAVFLPQVATEQGWDRDQLLSQLSRKAGLPADAWRRGAELSVFQAEVFGESETPDR